MKSETGVLRRSLGLIDASALVIGCVIGVGIFRSAASVARHLHTPGLIMAVWAAGGFLSFCGALCYAELGAAYPKTGGDYIYITKAYGPAAGFLFGWTKLFIERIGTIAILGFVFAEYLGYVTPLSALRIKAVATCAIVFLTLVNVVGVQVGTGVQNFLTALKMLCLLLMIGAGFLFSPPAGISPGPTGAGPTPPLLSMADGSTLRAFGVALAFVLWTYGGWTESAYVAGEIRNPEKILPRSILVGLSIVTVLYLLVNWVYLITIPVSEMPSHSLVAAEVMKKIFGPVGASATALMICGSAFGALNGYILTAGRLLLAVGRDHAVFRKLSGVSPRFATPAAALLFNSAGAVLLVWIGTFDQIVTYSTVVISIFFALAAMAVFILRIREPEVPRPVRVWGYPVTPVLFVLGIGLFIADVTWMEPREALFGFGLLALGIPFYFWSRVLERQGYNEATGQQPSE